MLRGTLRGPLPWLGGLIALYLLVPLVAFGVRLGTASQRGFGVPGLFPALYISVVCATISTVIIAVLGVPLAYTLARSRGRLAGALGVVVQLPLALPPVMGGILLIFIVGPYTTLGRFFGGHLTDSMIGIVLAQTFVAAPFLIVAARSAFAALDPALSDVAATMGHGELARFRRVALPLAASGIQAGLVLAWLRAFGEYGATVILAYHPFSLPVYTFNQFSAGGLPDTMAPTALALVMAAVAIALGRIHLRPSARRPRRSAAPPPPEPPTTVRAEPVSFALEHRLGSFRLSVSHRAQGQRLAIVGPSGSGKSALLRCLVGLYGADPGPVSFGARPVDEVAVEHRGVGYMAQSFGLFPHLSVWQQMLFATDASSGVAAYWLDRLHLGGLEDRFPDQLSGGQRQRVALAQALCRSPGLLLLDEPFSALDTPVRHELRAELRRLQRETGVATVLVTHDPEEAALLADQVIVLSDGRALQEGPTRGVFSRPATPEVARLLGIRNLRHATVAGPGAIRSGRSVVSADTGALGEGARVLWSVRPERVGLEPLGAAHGPTGPTEARRAPEGGARATTLFGELVDIADVGTAFEALVRVADDLELEARLFDAGALAPGQRVAVELPEEWITVWLDRSAGLDGHNDGATPTDEVHGMA